MELIGGYRPIRILGEGSRARVILGRQEASQSVGILGVNQAQGQAAESKTRLVAIKVFHEHVDRESIYQEIEAISAIQDRHIMRLDDLGSIGFGRPILVLQKLSTLSLLDLIRNRSLQPGEAVTVLAPLAQTIRKLHSVGVIHNRVGCESVLFDDDGSPVLAKFGSANRLRESSGWGELSSFSSARLSTEPGIIAELERFDSVCRTTLGEWYKAIGQPPALESIEDPIAWLENYERRLFELAEPLPVNFAAAQQPDRVGALPSRLPAALEFSSPAGGEEIPEQEHALLGRMQSAALAIANRAASIRYTKIRPRTWIVAAIAVAAVVMTGFVSASASTSTHSIPVSTSTKSSVNSKSWEPNPELETAISAEDPVVAASALLEQREICFQQRVSDCLRFVDQIDSSALAQDLALLEQASDSTELGISVGSENSAPKLLQELGDTVLLEIGAKTPLSLLIIRDEGGWKIRDLLPQAKVTSSSP